VTDEDLVVRLRVCAGRLAGTYSGPEMMGFFLNEAADEIERLRAELTAEREAERTDFIERYGYDGPLAGKS
jgi:hypothetical protein